MTSEVNSKEVKRLDRVIIRFAGDSGDGMQLTGDRFTSETASFGNDLSTLPNFPAEIRAPAGTLPGVSSFQVHFADHDILTPGDAPNVLVAMNPAALKANIGDVPRGAEVIVNTDEFTKRAMAKVGYEASPLEDGSLDGYSVHEVPLTTLTVEALKEFGLSRKDAGRSKNMFALGLLSWMYHRPTEGTVEFLRTKFAKKPDIAEANISAFQAGWNFGETTEDFAVSYEVAPAESAFPAGTYRSISGNLALAYGLIAAGQQADLPLFLGSYPITPASDILHELSRHKNFGVRTFQAEDEIAGADRRPGHAVRLLHRGPGRGPDRADVPHAGDAALRRLPRQRLRALAHPGGRRTAGPAGAVRLPAEPHDGRRHRGLLAVQARPADPRPPLGDPRHPRSRAPHRRYREGGRLRQHLVLAVQPDRKSVV